MKDDISAIPIFYAKMQDCLDGKPYDEFEYVVFHVEDKYTLYCV